MRRSLPEVKAKQNEYAKIRRSIPEVKAKQKAYKQTLEYKAKAKAHEQKPQVKAKRKAQGKVYRARPENKAKKKEHNSRPENKANAKEYNSRPEVKARKKEIRDRPDVKAKRKKLLSSPEYKAKQYERSLRPENKAKRKEESRVKRVKVLQYYSKHLSNSDIPCCRCCGENSHIDFLAFDHIAGRKQMDSELELVKLGYSSSIVGDNLIRWILKNNFPKGFQVLCQNCNYAKGIRRNNNKCPHQK